MAGDMGIGSLFSGIGGIELGLESCGLGPIAWQCDNDPHARAVLSTWWPSVRRYNDVREIDASAPRPEIICGGFPCQDISVAGKGAGLDGAQSGLWREFARIVATLRPSLVFIENVPPLVKRGLDRVLADLAACGFDAEWDLFRASDIGAPHKRERLFILAYPNGQRRDQGLGAFGQTRGRTDVTVRSSVDLANPDSRRCEGERLAQSGRLSGAPRCEPDRRGDGRYVHRFPPGPDGIADWHGAQPAICRSDARIPCGMDRGWKTKNGISDRLRLLGNAVCPQQAALAWRTLTARRAAAEEERPRR